MTWKLEQAFEFEGQSIAYDRFGKGNPVVLVHGTPFSSFVWRAIARELARHREVFVYDLLGYGQSEKREGQDVSLPAQNRLFAALLRFLSLVRPDVIAHDFGGATVLRAHLIDGCEYRRLLLVDPVAMRPWGSPFVRHVLRHEEAFAGMPDYIHEAILGAYLQGAAYRPLAEAARQAYLAPWTGPVGKPAFYRQIAQMDQRYTDEIQDHYPNLRCPSRLLWGIEDDWIPVERGRELARLLPGCQLTEIPGCGHLMQEDAPEAIIAAALNFFA